MEDNEALFLPFEASSLSVRQHKLMFADCITGGVFDVRNLPFDSIVAYRAGECEFRCSTVPDTAQGSHYSS